VEYAPAYFGQEKKKHFITEKLDKCQNIYTYEYILAQITINCI
jgi:hypothetical protein